MRGIPLTTTLRLSLLLLISAGLLAGCHKPAGPATADAKSSTPAVATAASAPTLLVSPEDLVSAGGGEVAGGAVVTGSLQPERRADLRAEVAAVVLQVLKENGEPVKRGDLLLRMDDTSIRDSLNSANESARAAQQAFEQAERQVQRVKTLQGQGMVSMQALEDAEVRRNSAQSELAAARARVVSAQQQLRRTEVRAPFDGVVSDRKVSAGDTAAIGKELVKVIDPASMRFEGLVSADAMGEVKIGAPVRFRVNGYPDTEFAGKVRRIDVSANAMTRQVAVLIDFADERAPRVAGLYAEGTVKGGAAAVPMLPETAVVRAGEQAYVWKVDGNVVRRQPVQVGERDARRGGYPLKGGVDPADRLLRNPGTAVVDGQKVEFAGKPALAEASAPASVQRK
jgi:RND family efflux transporter MFP subunit